MNLVKKLILVPIFLTVFALLTYQLVPLLKSYDTIFSLSSNSLILFTALAFLILTISLLFNLFVTFAQNWKMVLPVGLLASILPMLFLTPFLSLIFGLGILISLSFNYLTLTNTLKTYLTFNPNSLISPSIKQLASLLILAFSITYFLSINQIIQKTGFAIPDSLIDNVLKVVQPEPSEQENTFNLAIPPDLIKQTVKDQIQNLIKPYLNFIPAVLALLLFITLQSLTSIVNLLIHPLLWIIFYVLEKTGFIRFEVEQRLVKKMVV